jgi:hypothetical protein
MNPRRVLLLATMAVLAGCANISKVASGDNTVGGRLAVKLPGAWNQVNMPGADTIMWTQDGVTLDALQFWVGVADGKPIAPPGQDKRPLAFKASMQPHELVALMQSYYARDGSTVTLDKMEPADFVGRKGVRYRFTVVRKFDEVTLSGLGYAAVVGSELVALGFISPRLGFYPRHEAEVDAIARSAALK